MLILTMSRFSYYQCNVPGWRWWKTFFLVNKRTFLSINWDNNISRRVGGGNCRYFEDRELFKEIFHLSWQTKSRYFLELSIECAGTTSIFSLLRNEDKQRTSQSRETSLTRGKNSTANCGMTNISSIWV